ncbi:MAG TPA: hypothetical protein DGA22_06355 [Acidobacterium sp.]|nr:hypothetical protein [Acidobacterium sp.]
MDTAQLIFEIDSEIFPPPEARALLGSGHAVNHAKPRGGKRILSADVRGRIVAAQWKCWAKQKAAAKKTS